MENIPSDLILEFNPDTLQVLRKQYDLDAPGRIEEAINLLEEWLKKQEHFIKKDFPRDYLERTIIISKGSVERAKTKLDSLCTFRGLFPKYFELCDVKNSLLLNDIHGVFLPKLTSNHYRVYLMKNTAKSLNERFIEMYRYFFMQCEYIQAHDYCNGLVLLLDYTEANIMESVKVLNVVDMRESLRIVKDGYGMRIKGIHFLTGSKAIDAIVFLFKQIMSAKLAERIKTHTTMDTVYEYIPKDILPVEYGGREKPLIDVHSKFREILSSMEFTSYLNEMTKASTNEKLRKTDNNVDQLLGVAGTFRSFNID